MFSRSTTDVIHFPPEKYCHIFSTCGILASGIYHSAELCAENVECVAWTLNSCQTPEAYELFRCATFLLYSYCCPPCYCFHVLPSLERHHSPIWKYKSLINIQYVQIYYNFNILKTWHKTTGNCKQYMKHSIKKDVNNAIREVLMVVLITNILCMIVRVEPKKINNK